MDHRDTIAALSTAPGTGAIAVLRLSGADTLQILGELAPMLPESLEARHAYFTVFNDVDGIVDDMEEMVLDAELIDDLMHKKDPKDAQKLVQILISRFRQHGGIPVFKKLSDRLDEVRLRAEQGLISSIEFIKEL